MKNFIQELFYGNLEPQELNTVLTPTLRQKLNILSKKEDELYDRLEKGDRELFDAYRELYNEFAGISCADSFISGFKYGARFTFDTFVED